MVTPQDFVLKLIKNLENHGFRRQNQKLKVDIKQIVPCQNTPEEMSF